MHEQLGAILVENETCSGEQVATGLERQRTLAARNHYKHLGAILLELGFITVEQLHRALEWQKLIENRSDQLGSVKPQTDVPRQVNGAVPPTARERT